MSIEFICPRTGDNCGNANLCSDVNIPLDKAVPRIRQRVGGVKWNLAQTALRNEINRNGELLGANFSPQFDTDGTCTVCPSDIIDGDFSEKYGPRAAADAVTKFMIQSIDHVVEDLTPRGS